MKTKRGLEYFSFDVDFFQDEKIQFVSARFGTKGEAIVIRLLCKIYRNGYYTEWNDDIALLFAKGVGDNCQHSCVNDVVYELLKRGFFDKSIFERFSILTSKGIQSRYFLATDRRKKVAARKELLLIDPESCSNLVYENQNVNIPDKNVYISGQNVDILQQSKVKQSKVKESKSYSEAAPPADNPEPSPKPKKPKKPPLREREPENDMERVEKAYLQNWDTLYAQNRVQTADPVVTWNQTRALLKAHFEKLKPEQIIQAINNGLRDDWILKGGYSLATMLSASVLNRLINAAAAGTPPPGLSEKKSLKGLDTW